MNLGEFQRQFVKSILQNKVEPALTEVVRPGGTLVDASAVFNVHREGYVARLTEVLGENFEGVWWALGDEVFYRVSEGYIEKCPSGYNNLSDYGERFPSYLSSREDMSEWPFIEDLAYLDWSFKEAFHAIQHLPVDPSEFAKLQTHPELKFQFGPSCRLLRAQYTVYNIWKLRESEEAPEEEIEIDSPQDMILYKKDSKVHIHMLTPIGFNILSNLQLGKSVGCVLEECSEGDASEVAAVFEFIGSSGCVEKLY